MLGKMHVYTKDYYDAIGKLALEWALVVGLISMPTISHVGYCLAESRCNSAGLAIGKQRLKALFRPRCSSDTIKRTYRGSNPRSSIWHHPSNQTGCPDLGDS
ncbi:hypothetical protein ACFLV7_11815 [Chloroflexota bacterium]